MRKLLNTLYVTKPEAYLSKEGTNVVVSEKGVKLLQIPIQNIEAIYTFGYQGASPELMRLCAESGVSLVFFTIHGRFVARLQGKVSGNILLRHSQHRLFDDMVYATHLASMFITGKIYNSRSVLRRFVRDYPTNEKSTTVDALSEKLKLNCYSVKYATNLDEIRGIEGIAAQKYFEAFPCLILNNDPKFVFNGRNKRPPTDPVNALLSFGYSLLANDCVSALEAVGLDPSFGVLHVMRPGRYSLALDLMEEMRAYLVDRLVISLINNRQLSSSDFITHTEAAGDKSFSVILTDNGRKKFLTAWQTKRKTEITHPFFNEKIQLGLLPYCQAMLLSRYLRGDLDDYPVFLIK